jgi:hypothetical protein
VVGEWGTSAEFVIPPQMGKSAGRAAQTTHRSKKLPSSSKGSSLAAKAGSGGSKKDKDKSETKEKDGGEDGGGGAAVAPRRRTRKHYGKHKLSVRCEQRRVDAIFTKSLVRAHLRAGIDGSSGAPIPMGIAKGVTEIATDFVTQKIVEFLRTALQAMGSSQRKRVSVADLNLVRAIGAKGRV